MASGQEPLGAGRGAVPRKGTQAALCPVHIGPAPDPEDWWSYKENLQGNFVPGAAGAGIQASGPLGGSFLGPGDPLHAGSSSPSLPQEFGSASEPQRLTMGHYTCAFQEGSGSEWVESECGGGRLCVCGRVCREGGRQVLALLGTRASVATFPASSSAVATPLPRTFIIQLSYRGDRKNYNSHGLWGSGWPAALGPAGSCSFFPQ